MAYLFLLTSKISNSGYLPGFRGRTGKVGHDTGLGIKDKSRLPGITALSRACYLLSSLLQFSRMIHAH